MQLTPAVGSGHFGVPCIFPLAVLCGIALSLLASFNSHADTTRLLECRDRQAGVITIGLPERHRDLAQSMATEADPRLLETIGTACPAFAFGNEYQILDWLENGRIDAAVVSPFVAELLRKPGENSLSEFFHFTTRWPFSGVLLEAHDVRLRVNGADGNPDHLEAYDQIIESMLIDHIGATTRIVVDSHLSSALAVLLGYTEKRLGDTTNLQRQTFWKRFWTTLELRNDFEFQMDASETAVVVRPVGAGSEGHDAGAILSVEDQGVLRDAFVYSESLPQRLTADHQPPPGEPFGATAVQQWLVEPPLMEQDDEVAAIKREDPLYQFLDSEYVVH